MFRRILLATDGSPAVERQILYVEHLARVEPAEVIILHAYEPPAQYTGYAGYDDMLVQYRAVAQAVVDEVVGELNDDGVTAHGELRSGPAADAIIESAIDNAIDLIVLGTSNSGNLQELLGSVSSQVVRRAHYPVLLIP
jgi:nucleotide-binding universal stress UspA family protein